jgi:hypothetical protein
MWNWEAKRAIEASREGHVKETEQIGSNYLRNNALNEMSSTKQSTEVAVCTSSGT